MNAALKTVKITVVVNRQLSRSVMGTLFAAGVDGIHVKSGRTSFIEEPDGIGSLFSGKRLGNDPVEILTCFVGPDYEEPLLEHIATRFSFNTPGRGSVFSQQVVCLNAHELFRLDQILSVPPGDPVQLFRELQGICCIVQRGEGDGITRKCLDMGASVPVTTYGTGSGVRDKLGLLRITIPAEKELVNLVMSEYDIDSIMELMIREGHLDEPGKGFVYQYPVKLGIIDTRISRGRTGQVASIEQMVSTLDSLTGGMEWRRSRFENERTKSRYYLTDLVELSLSCDEGFGPPLMQAAMDCGAAGGTISKLKYRTPEEGRHGISPTREICRMIVDANAVESICAALEEAKGFGDEAHGILYSSPVPKAFTFIPKK